MNGARLHIMHVSTLAIMLAQLAAFAFDEQAPLPWVRTTVRPARELVLVPTFIVFEWQHRPLAFPTPAAYFALFYLAFAWVAVIAGLQLWAAFAFSRNSIATMWPLRLFRIVAGISTSVAFIPVLHSLLSVFVCADAVSATGSLRIG